MHECSYAFYCFCRSSRYQPKTNKIWKENQNRFNHKIPLNFIKKWICLCATWAANCANSLRRGKCKDKMIITITIMVIMVMMMTMTTKMMHMAVAHLQPAHEDRFHRIMAKKKSWIWNRRMCWLNYLPIAIITPTSMCASTRPFTIVTHHSHCAVWWTGS